MQSPRLRVNGAEVREERMRQGLEIADVAARVGITRSYLSRIEVNSRRLRPKTYQALINALSRKYPSFLVEDEEQPKEEE